MGLSASSLRLAMLTARKSNLEFEAQQINQQRMNLSNQSAAIYNDMLSMSVPTPPNANEFTKQVYTFNKGNGVSQLLSTTRNSSGPYDYDVLYKTPKTEDVLMKKQLNNVGIKYNNDQMTANIDGVDYALTLNGNEDKLNDYIKTQKTYENIKNVESQMQSLWSLSPDKELSSSQMKQYFETLGLTTYEEPTRTQVQNVETMDDAFQSVYYSGYDYDEKNVEFTYESNTPPIELDLSQKTLLKNTGEGTLTQGEDNKHYTYEIWKDSSTSTIKYPLTYNISQDDEGHWSWTLEDVKDELLSEFGVKYKKGICTKEGDTLKQVQEISIGGVKYDNFIYDSSTCKWSWNETIEGQWFKYQDNYIDIETQSSCSINEKNYDICTMGETIYFQEKQQSDNSVKVTEHWLPDIDKSRFGYDIDGNGVISSDEFIILEGNKGKTINNNITYIVKYDNNDDDKWTLTVASPTMFAAWTENNKCLTGLTSDGRDWYIEPKFEANAEEGYWYNTKTKRVNLTVTENDRYKVNTNKESKPDGKNWVWVSKRDDGNWEYTIDLSEVPQFEYNEQALNIDDNNNYYLEVDENNDDTIDYQNVYSRVSDDGQWSVKKRYTAEQLHGSIVTEKTDLKTGSELPNGIIDNEKYMIGIQYNDQTSWYSENDSVSIGNDYTIKQQNNGNFQLSGSDLPDGVAEVTDNESQNYSGSSTSNNITFKVTDKGANSSPKYSITATFKAWVTGEPSTWGMDDKQNGYSYDTKNHTVSLTTPAGVVAQMLLSNQNNNRNEDDKNITVNEMLAFYEAILEQFEFFGTSTAYKTKLDTARENYISTIDAKGVETPGENEVIYNFIDQNGNEAYLYVPLSCVNTNGQIDSTYAYMLETSYIEGQTETISQKANIIYDENGRIAKICFDDGTVVMPEITVEQDDEAYEAAMVKYDYERAKYEKALSDCNTKTQIIQEQDKKLELQLKSIDTEHTAIQTELEAVKKVLDSNIKSSFGTFNA